MYKFCRKVKKSTISFLIFLLILNPFLPALAKAEDVIIEPSSSPAIVDTGTAIGIAEAVTEVNTTKINSQIDTSVIPVIDTTQEIVEPFPSTSPLMSSSPTPDASQNIHINNQASATTSAEVISTTGDNTQTTQGDVAMTTGDSGAIATALTLANTTLVDSTLQIGVITILDTWYGDIVVDPPTSSESTFSNNTTELNSLKVHNDLTNVLTVASASAETGNNTQIAGGNASMVTGQAMALSQSNALVNTTLLNADIFTLLPENIWLWSGTIRNWDSPGSVITPSSISNLSGQAGTQCGDTCNTNINITNQANVTTTAIATASTGDNSQTTQGDARMSTGNAYAAAIATSVVNTTLINSRYRQLSLLLFAPWSGNLIFAYPDLQISARAPEQVNEGEDINCDITIKNTGYAKAKNVELRLSASETDQVIYKANDVWGELPPDSTTTRTFKIGTTGHAGQTIVLDTKVESESTEESSENNQVILNTIVRQQPSPQSISMSNNDISTETPKIRLSSQNNIHEFAYPGDKITYDMVIYNDGPIDAKNIVLTQEFYSPNGEKISEFYGKVGDLAINQRRNIRFVMRTGVELPSGDYYTQSTALGQSDRGVETRSNMVENRLALRLKQIISEAIENKVEAAEIADQGEVLGINTQIPPIKCADCLSFPWYIAITLGTFFYYAITARQRDFARALRWGLVLPLSAYGGLILSNPSCTQGITILPSAGSWCLWFLPASYAIYFGIMSFFRYVSSDTVLRVSWHPKVDKSL